MLSSGAIVIIILSFLFYRIHSIVILSTYRAGCYHLGLEVIIKEWGHYHLGSVHSVCVHMQCYHLGLNAVILGIIITLGL